MIPCRMRYWTWAKGSPMERSARRGATEVEKPAIETGREKETKREPERPLCTKQTNENTKRSLCNDRISTRCLLIQANVNPFLCDNDYIDDIAAQDKFLRPMDSNQNTLNKDNGD